MFFFEAKSEYECKSWVKFISEQIADSNGLKHSLPAPESKLFHKANQISEDQFLLMADTMDILLFQSRSVLPSALRLITGGEYDHIALILKYDFDPDEVWMVEAMDSGIIFRRWSDVRK